MYAYIDRERERENKSYDGKALELSQDSTGSKLHGDGLGFLERVP